MKTKGLKKNGRINQLLIICMANILSFSLILPSSYAATGEIIQSVGALSFSPEGTLFVGDNIAGAIYAFEMGKGTAPKKSNESARTADSFYFEKSTLKTAKKSDPVNIDNIDARIGSLLGIGQHAIRINDMAVHPVTQEIYLSVTRGYGLSAMPAIVKVNEAGALENIRLSDLKFTKHSIKDMPDGSKQFRTRGFMEPATAKDITKSQNPMSILAIMDIEFYNGEIFVAGISNEEFSSTLRRIPYPFTGSQSSSKIKMWHLSHDMYETRAPIRSMVVKNFAGTDYIVAAYTCSPIVLIPLDELRDGASVTGKTIGDIGNGQPIDLIVFKSTMENNKDFLMVTSNSRGPQIMPMDELFVAKGFTEETLKKGMKYDPLGGYPYGPMGFTNMFSGSSLHMDLLNDKFFVSITRDPQSGSLNLESLLTFFPSNMKNIYSEYDFPSVKVPQL